MEFRVAVAGPLFTLGVIGPRARKAGSWQRQALPRTSPSPSGGVRATAALVWLSWVATITRSFRLSTDPRIPAGRWQIAHAADLVAHRRSQPRDPPRPVGRAGIWLLLGLIGLWENSRAAGSSGC